MFTVWPFKSELAVLDRTNLDQRAVWECSDISISANQRTVWDRRDISVYANQRIVWECSDISTSANQRTVWDRSDISISATIFDKHKGSPARCMSCNMGTITINLSGLDLVVR